MRNCAATSLDCTVKYPQLKYHLLKLQGSTGRMLIGDADSELNLLQPFEKSLHHVLAQTMVHQDEIFRNQVFELHRLYQIQKIRMQEMDLKVNRRLSLHEECPNSFVSSFVIPNFDMKKKKEELKICTSRHMKDNFLLKLTSMCLKHERRPINLELPVSYGTDLSADVLFEKCGSITPETLVNTKCKFNSGKTSPKEELKLSLSTNTETILRSCAQKAREDQTICWIPHHFTNLKDSAKNSDSDLVPSVEYASEPNSSIRSRKNDVFHQNSRINSLTDFRTISLEKKPVTQGLEQCHDNLPSEVKSTRRELFPSHARVELDLNRALSEELSFNSIDHFISHSSKSTSLGPNGNEQEIKCSNDPSDSDQPQMTTWTTSPSKKTSEVNCVGAFQSVDLGSICRPRSKSKSPGSCSKNYGPENKGFQINLSRKNCQPISMHQVNSEKSKDVLYSHYSNQELVEDAESRRFPVSNKSDSTPDDTSSNVKKWHCGVNMETQYSTSQVPESVIPVKKVYQLNTIPSISSEEEEVDISVENGAVSLLHFSSVCSAKNQDYVPRSISHVERDAPQCSSESYESIVLKHPEISLDLYSATSTPVEVDNSRNGKDYRTKLKRGRRMKDFRKEILPELASLTRQEICEDVRIMRVALRSLEYKKHRSKTSGISDNFSPLNSKRSRHSYARRRR